jgi:hypothetical protein
MTVKLQIDWIIELLNYIANEQSLALALALTTRFPLIFHTQFHVCQASSLKKESHMCYVTAKGIYPKYYKHLEIGFGE